MHVALARCRGIAVATLFLLGCVARDDARSVDRAVSLAAFEDEYVVKLCHLYFSCSSLAGDLPIYLHNEAHCRQHLSFAKYGYYLNLASEDLQSAQRGELSYDANAAGECIDSLDCHIDERPSASSACDRILRGHVPIGGACERSVECESIDAVCGGGTGRCDATCQPAAEIGESCRYGGCTTHDGTLSSICAPENVCATYVERLVSEGELCGSVLEGTVYTRSVCANGTECIATNRDEPRVCVRLRSEGEPCDSIPCATPNQCSESFVCEAPVQQRLGDPCYGPGYWGLDGRWCNRYDGLQCSAQHTCEAYSGSAGVGESCALGDYARPCIETAYCDLGRCYEKIANGEACNSPDRCLSGHCDRETRLCAVRPSCN